MLHGNALQSGRLRITTFGIFIETKNTFGMFIGTDNTFGILTGTYTYGVFIGTQHHRAAAMAALFPVGELARPLPRYALVLAAVTVHP